jgi:hypothetical protein
MDEGGIGVTKDEPEDGEARRVYLVCLLYLISR